MAHLQVKRFIAAPPERVWAVVQELERQGDWMADVRRLEVVTTQKRGAGALIRVTSTLFGLPVVRDVMEIIAWEPPRRMGVLHRGQFQGTGSFELQPFAGGTIFVWIEDFRPPLGPLGELAFRLAVRPHLRRVFGRSLTNLKDIVESGAPLDAGNATS